MKRVVEDVKQIRLLNNPTRLEILTYLRSHEPATPAEIAEWLGVEEHLLYYHLALLVKAGFVKTEGVRRGATRPETVYASGPGIAVGGLDLRASVNRKAVAKNVAYVLGAAAREYGLAMDANPEQADDTCTLVRLAVRLSDMDRRELTKKLLDLAEWARGRQTERGSSYGMTIAVSRLVPKGKREPNS